MKGLRFFNQMIITVLVMVFAVGFACDLANAQEKAPFEIVAAGTAGFRDLDGNFGDAGGGFQLGFRVNPPGSPVSLQGIVTKVSIGNSDAVGLRKVDLEGHYNFDITKHVAAYLILSADNNWGGEVPSPSTDFALGLGGQFRIKTFFDAMWARPPWLDGFAQIKWVDGDAPSAEFPNAPGTYTQISLGVSFSPGQKPVAPTPTASLSSGTDAYVSAELIDQVDRFEAKYLSSPVMPAPNIAVSERR